MGFILQDGTGTGTTAKIDPFNRLVTKADFQSQISFASDAEALAFVANTGELPVNATGGQMFYFLNNSQSRHIHVSKLWVNWNGGNTNFNRPLRAALYGAISAPTGNNTANNPINLNTGSGNAADIIAYHWNGVGNSMTGSVGGGVVANAIVNQGMTQIDINDALLIQYNDSIAVNLIGGETGVASVLMSFFFQDPH